MIALLFSVAALVISWLIIAAIKAAYFTWLFKRQIEEEQVREYFRNKGNTGRIKSGAQGTTRARTQESPS